MFWMNALLFQRSGVSSTSGAPPCSSIMRTRFPLTRITPETFAAGSAWLDESREKILYTGESYATKRKNKQGIFVYDIAAGKSASAARPYL